MKIYRVTKPYMLSCYMDTTPSCVISWTIIHYLVLFRTVFCIENYQNLIISSFDINPEVLMKIYRVTKPYMLSCYMDTTPSCVISWTHIHYLVLFSANGATKSSQHWSLPQAKWCFRKFRRSLESVKQCLLNVRCEHILNLELPIL